MMMQWWCNMISAEILHYVWRLELWCFSLGGLLFWEDTLPLHCTSFNSLSVCSRNFPSSPSLSPLYHPSTPPPLLFLTFSSPLSPLLSSSLLLFPSAFSSQPSEEVLETLEDGLLMDPPEGCPTGIYDIMCSCWEMEPNDRPSFPSLQQMLSQSFGELRSSGYIKNIILFAPKSFKHAVKHNQGIFTVKLFLSVRQSDEN